MTCNDNGHSSSNCVCEVVRFINELQDSITDNCLTGCDTPFLGGNCNTPFANTRPFVVFDKSGDLFVPASCYSVPGLHVPLPSPLLRVESADDCCAVLRSLIPDVSCLTPEDIELLAASVNPVLGTANVIDVVSRLLVCQYSNGITRADGASVLQIPLKASQFCITVDLSYYSSIQCLRDAHVRGV